MVHMCACVLVSGLLVLPTVQWAVTVNLGLFHSLHSQWRCFFFSDNISMAVLICVKLSD